jgi:hypothetical protein
MIQEPADWGVHVFAALSVLLLILLYNFGIVSRSVIMPPTQVVPLKRQLLAGIPTGLVTMGLYGKTAIPSLSFGSASVIFDAVVIAGNAIVFGMLSRDTLDKMVGPGGVVPPLRV